MNNIKQNKSIYMNKIKQNKSDTLVQICEYLIDMKIFLINHTHSLALLFAQNNDDNENMQNIHEEYIKNLYETYIPLAEFFNKIISEDKKKHEIYEKQIEKSYKIIGNHAYNEYSKPESYKELLIQYYAKKTNNKDYNVEKYIDYCIILHKIITTDLHDCSIDNEFDDEYKFKHIGIVDYQIYIVKRASKNKKNKIYNLMMKYYNNMHSDDSENESDNSDDEDSD
jgi:hypothetical protein